MIDLSKLKLVDNESFAQEKSNEPRKLTQLELDKLARQDALLVNDFKKNKIELDAKKNWDLFYRRNKANFFKDRYWTFREFDELNDESDKKTLLEIGSGVGNFMYPLIKQNPSIYVYACDFSTDAIQLLKSNPDYDETKCYGFVCDVTKLDSLVNSLPNNVKVDFVTLIFVMSAIHPSKMLTAVENISKIVKQGGCVLFRDYGINDHAMIRFEPGHKLDEKLYVRQDGTRSYFFTLEEVDDLFVNKLKNENNEALFTKVANEYVFRETVNVKENLRVPRVFIQSKFIRR